MGNGRTQIRLRADAALNRDRIVAAAREVFAQRGIDVPVSAIARRAGVGVATLFRRFPSKQALIAEVFSEQFDACGALLDDALANPDPWQGFCDFLEAIRASQIHDRVFTQAFLAAFPHADNEDERAQAERKVAELVHRAQSCGRLRADFSPRDLPLIMLAVGGVSTIQPELADAASRRLLAYLLQAFEAGSGDSRLPPPPNMGIQTVLNGSW